MTCTETTRTGEPMLEILSDVFLHFGRVNRPASASVWRPLSNSSTPSFLMSAIEVVASAEVFVQVLDVFDDDGGTGPVQCQSLADRRPMASASRLSPSTVA